MTKLGDFVYLQSDSSKQVYKVTGISGEHPKATVKLESVYPGHPATIEHPELDTIETIYPQIGDTVIVTGINVDYYGGVEQNVGKIGTVKEYGLAHKSAIIKFEDGSQKKIHFGDLGYGISSETKAVKINEFDECSPKLIGGKEQVMSCIMLEVGEDYYNPDWNKSQLPRKKIEKCIAMANGMIETANQCYKMSPQKVKGETSQRMDRVQKRVVKSRQVLDSRPRKECNGNRVMVFDNPDEIARYTSYSDQSACDDAGGKWNAEKNDCEGADAMAHSFNMIVNDLHTVGLAMQKFSGKHCNCKIADYDAFTQYHYAYCEGASGHHGATQKGSSLHHKLGIHHTEIDMLPEGDGVKVHLKYTDSGHYTGSKPRMNAVKKIMEKEVGLKCKVISLEDTVIECDGKMSDPKMAKAMALFYTGTLNADISSKAGSQATMDKNLNNLWKESQKLASESGCKNAWKVAGNWEV